MNVRRMPSAPPNSPASNTTLSRGDAWPDWDASVVVQSSWANTNAAKSTSWESSTSRSRVDRPGLNVVVQGSTSATSSSPRVIAWSSFACLPDEPMKMRGLIMAVALKSQALSLRLPDRLAGAVDLGVVARAAHAQHLRRNTLVGVAAQGGSLVRAENPRGEVRLGVERPPYSDHVGLSPVEDRPRLLRSADAAHGKDRDRHASRHLGEQ